MATLDQAVLAALIGGLALPTIGTGLAMLAAPDQDL